MHEIATYCLSIHLFTCCLLNAFVILIDRGDDGEWGHRHNRGGMRGRRGGYPDRGFDRDFEQPDPGKP